jgi:hypothetical protein
LAKLCPFILSAHSGRKVHTLMKSAQHTFVYRYVVIKMTHFEILTLRSNIFIWNTISKVSDDNAVVHMWPLCIVLKWRPLRGTNFPSVAQPYIECTCQPHPLPKEDMILPFSLTHKNKKNIKSTSLSLHFVCCSSKACSC